MKVRLMLSLALAAIVALPQGAQAQEPETAELAGVSYWEIAPADVGKFMAVAEKVVKAAHEAGLGPDQSWHMWQNMHTVAIVGRFNKAELDDPQVWMKQFMGTPGEATLMQAFQDMEDVSLMAGSNEIHQAMPDWSYLPEVMSEDVPAWVHINEFWVKSGEQNFQKWNTLIGDFMAFFKDVGYAYPVWGNMVRYGDNRAIFVTGYSNPSEYHGAKGIEAVVKQHMAADRWQELLERLNQLTNRAEEGHWMYLPAQSYMVAPEETGSR